MITGLKIKKSRQLLNISLKEMAINIEMDLSTYSRIEREQTKLTEEKIELILNKLNVSRGFIEQIDDLDKLILIKENKVSRKIIY